MAGTRSGTLHVGRILGFELRVHWGWLILLVLSALSRSGAYSGVHWAAIEYLALFALVLVHELGHALVGRAVGGDVSGIVLYPFAGATIVEPPERPLPTLLTVAAGPLGNLLLIPALAGLEALSARAGWGHDPRQLIGALALANKGMLAFNLLPVYPLDGGRLLHGALWLLFGRADGLRATSVVGLIGSLWIGYRGLLAGHALAPHLMLAVIFVSIYAWQNARMMDRIPGAWRHLGVRCPKCGESPPEGPFWTCSCGCASDAFLMEGECPRCGRHAERVACLTCGERSTLARWRDGTGASPMAAAPPPRAALHSGA